MKILRLDLKAFGPFNGVTLSPHEGQYGVHIVYGANEAGKSSSLRALRQWLYGIPHNSSDGFLYPNADMRIGGVIETDEGTQIEFIRRKGRTKTLRGPDDTGIFDDAELAHVLGGVDEAAFSHRYGIDYEELRRGGHAVAHGSGDLGELLFAAGAGVADVGRIQSTLDADAKALFTPRGQKQSINAAVSAYKELTEHVKKYQLPSSKWREHDKAVREADKRRSDLDDELAALRKRASLLDRVEKALPLIGTRRELVAQFESVKDAPLLPDDFQANRSTLITSLRHEENNERVAQRDIESLRSQIDAIVVPIALLDRRSAINDLKDRLGAWHKAQKDLPLLITRKKSAEERVLVILTDLGKPLDFTVAEQLNVSSVRAQKLQSLANRHGALQAAIDAAKTSKRKHERDLDLNRQRLKALPPETDSQHLRRVIREVSEYGQLDAELIKAQEALAAEETTAGVKLSRLRLWQGTLEDLEQLSVPSIETIERFEAEIRDAEDSSQRADTDLQQLQQELKDLTNEHQSLQLEQRVPTEVELEEARNRRDEGWKLILGKAGDTTASDSPDVVAFIHEFAAAGTLHDAFYASVTRADDISDRLRREASRVSRVAQLHADIESNHSQTETQNEECTRRRDLLKTLRDNWNSQWQPVGITPLSPREMKGWLRSHDELSAHSQTLRARRTEVESLAADIRHCRGKLESALAALEKSSDAGDESLQTLLEQCSEVAESIDDGNRNRRACEQEVERITDDLEEAKDALSRAEEAASLWKEEWVRAVAILEVEAASDPDIVNGILQQFKDLQDELRERSRFAERIGGIENESEAFAAEVRSLLAELSPDLIDRPFSTAVQDLYDRLSKAEKDHVKREGLEKSFSDAETRLNDAASKLLELKEHLRDLCALAGAESHDELPEIEQRAAKRKEFERQITEINGRLTDLAAGVALDEFVLSVSDFDVDAVHAERNQLQDRLYSLGKERQDTDESVGENRNELQRMNGQSLAAEAQEQAELVLSEIRGGVEQFIRLHLASVILKRAIERYRDASQGPILGRASDLFARLTLNSFSGLRAEFNDKGEAVIVGVRARSGQLVHVNGMSEGTCDQMYLALRLAVLESAITSGRRLPFVVDDVLIMFDDARAGAALEAFAELSRRTQVIFFTHHEHLLELARSNVPSDSLFIHYLGSTASRG
jgi:uncharacterized protein YhaN